MAIIEQSSAFNGLLRESPLFQARLKAAEDLVKIELAGELLTYGIYPSSANVDAVYDGLPDSAKAMLLYARM